MHTLLLPFFIGSLAATAPSDTFPTPEIPPIVAMCAGQPSLQAQQDCTNEKIMDHVRKSISYPEAAREQGIEGKVFIAFTIGVDGFARDAVVLRGVHELLDKEARRIVESMPIFIPARISGEFVPFRMTLPILFALD